MIFARIRNLLRGLLASWVGRREHRSPEAVFEAAIQERLARYTHLREAAAGVIYMRSKLARQHEQQAAELARIDRQLAVAVDQDDDAAALALIQRRDGLRGEVERLAGELKELTTEADGAKGNLIAFQNEIVRLREEKVRTMARLANAKARLRLQTTLGGLSPDADIQALEAVRDEVNRLATEVQMSREGADTELERRLGTIREAEAAAAARAQLEELKKARKRDLVPMVLPERERVAAAP